MPMELPSELPKQFSFRTPHNPEILKDPEIIEFCAHYKSLNRIPPEIRYSDSEIHRIRKETKSFYHDEISIIKKVYNIFIKTIRKIMSLICKESTFDERRKMYNDALQECLKYNNMAKFSEYKKMKSSTMTKTIAIADAIGIAGGVVIGIAGGGIVGGPIGAAVGGGVGAFLGVVGGTTVGGIAISQNFKKWKKTIDSDKFIKKLVEFHHDHEELRNFICLFSGNLITDPVVTPSGHVFERDWITIWITEKEEELKAKTHPDWSITHPYRAGKLSVNDLKTDYESLAKMKGVYSRLLSDDIKLKELPKPIKDALIAIKKDIDNQIKLGLEIVEHSYTNDFMKKKISKEEYLKLEGERSRIKAELLEFINP